MSEIEDLHQRLVAAMDRIGAGAQALSDRAGTAPSKAALEQALEEERLTNAQLEERLRALRAKHDDDMAALRAEFEAKLEGAAEAANAADAQSEPVEPSAEALSRLDGELQRLRAANEQLRHANSALREANQAGVGEPHLINKAMLAELEGLRAARATEVAEAQAIVAQLTPILEAASGGEV